MNNFHIYEEIGKGRYSVVYKVLYFPQKIYFLREEKRNLLNMWQLKALKNQEEKRF